MIGRHEDGGFLLSSTHLSKSSTPAVSVSMTLFRFDLQSYGQGYELLTTYAFTSAFSRHRRAFARTESVLQRRLVGQQSEGHFKNSADRCKDRFRVQLRHRLYFSRRRRLQKLFDMDQYASANLPLHSHCANHQAKIGFSESPSLAHREARWIKSLLVRCAFVTKNFSDSSMIIHGWTGTIQFLHVGQNNALRLCE